MTQSAEPSQITFSAMRDLFAQKFPNLVGPFDQVKPDLEAGKGAQALANLIGCEVEVRDDQGFSTYCWTGRSGPFEMKVPKPFDPAPQRPSEPQQQRQVQELVEEPVEKPVQAEPEQAGESPPAEPEPAPPEAPAPGLFAALAALLGESTLLMTVARTGEADKEPVLTVTVVPQGEEAFTPVCLEGTVSELDTHFVSALTARTMSKKSLAEQVEALKTADKELEEAKKKEVEAKNKQAEAKKKVAQKKEEEAKTEEKQAEEKAEAEKQQEALF